MKLLCIAAAWVSLASAASDACEGSEDDSLVAFSLKQRKHLKHQHVGPVEQSATWSSFSEVATKMTQLPWKDITWGPLDKYGKPANNFALGGCIVNGLLYTMAFAEGGGTNWEDYVQGIGTVVGGLVGLVPGVGPILSMVVTFAMSLFHAGSDDSALADLYKQIMKEVRTMLRAQEVQDAMAAAKGQLAGFMQMLAAMPMDFLVDNKTSQVEKYQHWYRVLERYITIMDASEYNIFGNEANCTLALAVPMQPNDKPSQDCLDFWAAGAIFFQFQYVLMHLNIMAQMAAFATFEAQRSTVLSALRGKAATYHKLLNASYQGFLKPMGPPTKCMWKGTSCNDATCKAMTLNDTQWDNENVSCITGCVTYFQTPFRVRFPNLCSAPDAKYPNGCSQSDFDFMHQIRIDETKGTYEPMLERLRNLSISSYSAEAKQMVHWLLNDPPKPNKTVPQVRFCQELCDEVHDNALNQDAQWGTTLKNLLNCRGACSAAILHTTPTKCYCANKCLELKQTFLTNIAPWQKSSDYQNGYPMSAHAFQAWVGTLAGNFFKDTCISLCHDQLPTSTLQAR